MHKLILFLLVALSIPAVDAQQNVASPYSRYALGDLNSGIFAAYSGMGSVSIALADSNQLNFINPASYAFIQAHKPIFDIGVAGQLISASSGSDQEKYNAVGLRNITLGFPVSKRTGLCFGVMPYSSVGYNMSVTVAESGLGDVTYKYSGSGGINRLFLGTGVKLINQNNHKLSLGLNASFLFGGLERTSIAILPAGLGMLHSKVVYRTLVSDFLLESGLLYRTKLKKQNWLNVGAILGVPSSVNARQEVLAYTFRSLLTENLIDTVQYLDTVKGTVSIPLKLGFGASFEFNKPIDGNATRRTIISAQYELQNWSDYAENFGSNTVYDNLKNSSNISFGFQFTPYVSDSYNMDKIKFWHTINYRLGFRYSDTYLQLNNTQLKQYGISFGFGIPLIQSSSLSSLNLGFEFGKRGTANNNLLLENYFNFFVGFSISPHRNDGWFYKRKYD